MEPSLVACPLLTMGYLIKKYISNYWQDRKWTVVISLLTGFLLLAIFGISISMQNNHYEGFYLLFLLSVFGGTIMVLCLSILNERWLKFAAYWGKFSLVILCFHNFILIPTAKIFGKFIHQSMVWAVVTFIILYVSFLFIIPLTSKICPSLFNIKTMTKKYDYLLVGAGLFSVCFAYRAKQAGKKCLVIDKRSQLGGNMYCDNIEGINVHKYGAHIFHTSNKQVWDFVNSIVEFNRYTNSPIANYKGKLFNLPFNMNTFYQMWGVLTPEEASAKINEQKAEAIATQKGRKPQNLEEQALTLVGKDIFEN